MRRSARHAAIVLLILVSLALSACDNSSEQGAADSRGDEALPTFDLHAALANLNRLSSNYSEFDVTWTGARNDVPVSGRLDMERVQVRDPVAQEIFATVHQEEAGKRNIIGFVQIGDQGWFYDQHRADTWREISGRGLSDFTDGTFFTPETFFEDFDLRRDMPSSPSPEKVNGVLAYRYNFDTENLISDDIEFREAWGRVYTSAEGGYLIKLSMTAEVVYHTSDGVFESGLVQVEFDVSDIGQAFIVELPRMARADLPLPPDVTLPDPTPVPLSRREERTPVSDNRITYQTKASLTEVADMYQTGMPEHGWQALTYDIPLVQTARHDTARLQHLKGDEGVAIIIQDEQGTTTVRMNFEDASDVQEDLCDSISKCGILVLTDIPVVPDAEVTVFISGGGLGGRLHYETTGSVEEIVRFYTTAMPADGWSEAILANYTPEPDATALGYVKNDEGVAISIKKIQDVTEVLVESGPTALAVWDYPNLEDLRMAHEFPVVPDARLNRLLPGQLGYLTDYSLAEVVRFYESALPDGGWTIRPGGVHNAKTAILRYETDETTATLMVKQDVAEGSMVWITISP